MKLAGIADTVFERIPDQIVSGLPSCISSSRLRHALYFSVAAK